MFDQRKYGHDYYLKHKERINKRCKEYYINNKISCIERSTNYRNNNIERTREQMRIRRKLNKESVNFQSRVFIFRSRYRLMEILNQYTCIKCEEGDYRCLHFDHINGGGNKYRKKFGTHGSRETVRYYLKHPEEARINLQVLCANCNTKKSESE